MATKALVDHRTFGPLVLSRFGEVGTPKPLAAHLAAFKAAHEVFEEAATIADEAKKKRDDALTTLGNADTTLDASIDPLADKMVGAGLGTRPKPFGDASPHSPTKLKALPYKVEVEAVRELVSNVRARKPAADVVKCLDVCAKAATASEAAMKAFAAPQTAYTKALGARDATLVDWTRTFTKLKVNSEAVWHEDKATFAAVFADPSKVQRPVKKKKKKVAKTEPGKAKAEPEKKDGE